MSQMGCTRLAGNAGPKNLPSPHHRTTLSGYIFATKAHIDNRKKLIKQQYFPHMFLQYGELTPTNGWYLMASLGHPSKFQRVSRLGSVTAWHSSSGRQPNFAALNRGRHLYSAGRPSRWALAHILVFFCLANYVCIIQLLNFRWLSTVHNTIWSQRIPRFCEGCWVKWVGITV